MKTRRSRTLTTLGLAVLILAALPAHAGGGRWLHIRVQEDGGSGQNVSLDLPFDTIESFLPALAQDQLEGRATFGGDTDEAQVRAILAALRDSPDGQFVKVQGVGESARVAKEHGYLVVHVEDDGERVNVRVPMAFVEALLGDETEGLDIAAGLRKLGELGDEALVTVDGDQDQVRIWIDARQRAD